MTDDGGRDRVYSMPSAVVVNSGPVAPRSAQLSLAPGHTSGQAPIPAPGEVVIRPPPGTLARGRFEVTKSTVWLCVAAALAFSLTLLWIRLRAATRVRNRKLEEARRPPALRS